MTAAAVVAGESRSTSNRERWAERLFPVALVRVRWFEAVAVLLTCVPVAYLRVGWATAWRGTVWAEDGKVFLQEALTQGLAHSFLEQFAGYWHLVPRVLTSVVVALPLSWQGIGMGVGAAVVQALVALVAYVATRGYLPSRTVRASLALFVVAVPVSPEVTDSVANLQWFLLFGAGVALLWTPRTRPGWALICVVVIATCGSGAFGLVVLGLVAVRAAIQFRRETIVVLALAAVTSAVQVGVMLGAPPRVGGQKLHSAIHLQTISSGYLRRVVGDGFLGWRISGAHPHRVLAAALLGGAVLVVAALAVPRRGAAGHLVPVSALFLMSAGFDAPIAVLSGVDGNGSYHYYVPGTLFFGAGTIALIADALAATRQARTARTLGAGIVSLGLLGVLGFGVATSYDTGHQTGRAKDPGWSQSLREAAAMCRGLPDQADVRVRISPSYPYWFATLPCSMIRSR